MIFHHFPEPSIAMLGLNETTRHDLDHLFGLVEDVGEVALATVLAVVHGSHEDTSTTLKRKNRLVFRSSRKDCPKMAISHTSGEGHSRRRRSILPSPSTL